MTHHLLCPACNQSLDPRDVAARTDNNCPYCRNLVPTAIPPQATANQVPLSPADRKTGIQVEKPAPPRAVLRQCPSCGNAIDELCLHCPYCEQPLEPLRDTGRPEPNWKRKEKGWQRPWLATLGGLVLPGGLLGALYCAWVGDSGWLVCFGGFVVFLVTLAVSSKTVQENQSLGSMCFCTLSLAGVIFLGVAVGFAAVLCIGLVAMALGW